MSPTVLEALEAARVQLEALVWEAPSAERRGAVMRALVKVEAALGLPPRAGGPDR